MPRRYWIEFERGAGARMFGLARFGVTAEDPAAALDLIASRVFHGRALPPVSRMVEDVDVSTLDPEDVQEMMGDPQRPGLWFPLGFQD
ncbi:hypothetical protein [Albimonas pacifica]|uniref:Uncharacterized protein n=1 Tax=Albimonas pacifica TaxID=1114924 RepID=A0A1I3F594_9RHOB|nr:hypothetical protein [Albimonas pacifica]SFI06415.1 hypothetical protein SAMN05216258_10475 [Albimonas pacifica]